MWEEKLKVYDALVAKCPRFKRKRKTMPYTSANGYMFSLFNRDRETGFRFAKAVQEKYMEEFLKTLHKSHGERHKGCFLGQIGKRDDIQLLRMKPFLDAIQEL